MKGGSAKNADSFPEIGVEVMDLGEDTSLDYKEKTENTGEGGFFHVCPPPASTQFSNANQPNSHAPRSNNYFGGGDTSSW